MKYTWQNITKVVAVAVLACYFTGVLLMRKRMQVPACEQVHVLIDDKDLRQYILEEEVCDTLERCGIYPVGKRTNEIAFHAIEQMLSNHVMVSSCECYQTVSGDVYIHLTQREPLLRVSTADSTYYIATDRGEMPVCDRIKTSVVMATGKVDRNMATHELYDLAQWLRQDEYWSQRITQIDVQSPDRIYLIQHKGDIRILLGNCQDFARKLNKLHKWYNSSQYFDCKQYTMVDIQYCGQVIGVKKKK